MTDDLIMTVERDPASGRWRVVADDGSILEDGFVSRGAALRYIEDRADVSDRQVRALVARCSPDQRRELRAMLDDLDGAGE